MYSVFFVTFLTFRIFLGSVAGENVDSVHGNTYDSGLRSPDQAIIAQLCPDYSQYARIRHKPYSKGPLELPSQRPHPHCRKFTSPAVEQVIEDVCSRLKDPDLAKLFENAFPNTLDTTVLWHVDGVNSFAPKSRLLRDTRDQDRWQGAQSFIVTGDINAEWLRDSTNQLAGYQALAKNAPELSNLILGAINTQAEFVIQNPYCNAFQPPNPSGLSPSNNGQNDVVHPVYEPSVVFECKYELDSLANFLSLTNQFHSATGSVDFLTDRWFLALQSLMQTLDAQLQPTFDPESGAFQPNAYTFRRLTDTGTETLNLHGTGNPFNRTGLIRSAFRPSDDATTFGFFIPANAMMSVELGRVAKMLRTAASQKDSSKEISTSYVALAQNLEKRSKAIRQAIYDYAVVDHPVWGDVFAFEVDGYGSYVLMDDANIPSLLSLPYLGFVDVHDEIYQNTRRMILSAEGNPYYLTGPEFSGIGGPHIGVRNAWPMSVLMQAMTSTNDEEILACLEKVKKVSVFGLINESVDVMRGVNWFGEGMTRSWFAWANSVFAQTILMLADKKPHLVFEYGVRYVAGTGLYQIVEPVSESKSEESIPKTPKRPKKAKKPKPEQAEEEIVTEQ